MGNSWKKTLVGVTIVIALTIALHYAGALGFLERFFRRLVSGTSGSMYRSAVTIRGTDTPFGSADELAEAYRKAGEEIRNLQVNSVRVTLLEEENDALRNQLRFFERHPLSHIGADVVGRNVEPIGNTLVINRGQNDGLKKGQPVIVNDGVFIGKIVRVEEAMSIVQLVSDGQSKIAASVMNQDKSIGIVEGGYGISVRMNFIPQNETVTPGDIIITSGLEEGIPKGLLIGTVEAVEKEAYQPFQRAVLTTLAPLDNIGTVSVILSDDTTSPGI